MFLRARGILRKTAIYSIINTLNFTISNFGKFHDVVAGIAMSRVYAIQITSKRLTGAETTHIMLEICKLNRKKQESFVRHAY